MGARPRWHHRILAPDVLRLAQLTVILFPAPRPHLPLADRRRQAGVPILAHPCRHQRCHHPLELRRNRPFLSPQQRAMLRSISKPMGNPPACRVDRRSIQQGQQTRTPTLPHARLPVWPSPRAPINSALPYGAIWPSLANLLLTWEPCRPTRVLLYHSVIGDRSD